MIARQLNIDMITNPVTVKIDFYFIRPKKFCRKKDNAGRIACPVRPDIDNLCKAVFDALNGIAWRDDGLIWSVGARKWYCEIGGKPRTEIEAY